MKLLTYLLVWLSLISCSETQKENSSNDSNSNALVPQQCFERMVSWNYSKKDFKDSLISLRQLNSTDSNTFIICGSFFPELELKMYEYFKESRDVFNGKIRSSILGIVRRSDSTFVANYSLLVDSTQQAVEMRRLLLKDGEVIGINNLPTISDGFTPIEDYQITELHLDNCIIIVDDDAEPNSR